MPAIHAGMTKFAFLFSVDDRKIMIHFPTCRPQLFNRPSRLSMMGNTSAFGYASSHRGSLAKQCLLIEHLYYAALHQNIPIDDHCVHAAAVGGVNQISGGIHYRTPFGAVKIPEANVGFLSYFDGADAVVPERGSGAIDGGHFHSAFRGHNGRLHTRVFKTAGCEIHGAGEVHEVSGRTAVCAKAHANTALDHLRKAPVRKCSPAAFDSRTGTVGHFGLARR